MMGVRRESYTTRCVLSQLESIHLTSWLAVKHDRTDMLMLHPSLITT